MKIALIVLAGMAIWGVCTNAPVKAAIWSLGLLSYMCLVALITRMK